MAGILAIGELVDGQPTGATLELATLASSLATNAETTSSVLLVGDDLADAAATVASYGPDVRVVTARHPDGPDAANLAVVAAALIEQHAPDLVLVGSSPDSRDVAGLLLGLTDLPILVAAANVARGSQGVEVQSSTFGGRLTTTSSFSGTNGIVVVRPGAAAAEPAGTPGTVEHLEISANSDLPAVTVTQRVTEAAAGPSIDDARVVVGAGRGVGGPDGIAIVAELATALDGAVGASRAAVDSGWIDFNQQIGQTGKTVKPDLYIAVGVSGAIQHKVGIQAAGTIISINKDPDAPISEFADLVVIGDLFELVPRLSAAIRETRESG